MFTAKLFNDSIIIVSALLKDDLYNIDDVNDALGLTAFSFDNLVKPFLSENILSIINETEKQEPPENDFLFGSFGGNPEMN